jgi:hypothetical protein
MSIAQARGGGLRRKVSWVGLGYVQHLDSCHGKWLIWRCRGRSVSELMEMLRAPSN